MVTHSNEVLVSVGIVTQQNEPRDSKQAVIIVAVARSGGRSCAEQMMWGMSTPHRSIASAIHKPDLGRDLNETPMHFRMWLTNEM